MSDIFLSYSRHDEDKARQLARALEDEGFTVFWDRHIQAGQIFDQVIRRELDEAGAVIVLWSRDSVTSDWVKDEAERAKARGVLVPVLVDDVPLPLGFGRVQTADVRSWRGGPSYEAVSQIAAAVRAAMTALPAGLPGRGGAAPPRPPRPRRRRKRVLIVTGALVLVGLAATAAGALTLLEDGGVVSTPSGMVLVPAGQHAVGAPATYTDVPGDGIEVVPERTVETPGFWVEQAAVSHAEYRAFLLAKARSDLDEWRALAPADWLAYGGTDVVASSYPAEDAARPVDGVPSADAAARYCRFAGRRLVTEEEWEVAERKGKISTGAVQEWVADARSYGATRPGQAVLRGSLPGLQRQVFERTTGPATATLIRSAGVRCAADDVRAGDVDPCSDARGFAVWQPFCEPSDRWPEEVAADYNAGFHPADHYHLEASRPGTAVVSLTDTPVGDGRVETKAVIDAATRGNREGIRFGPVVWAGGGDVVELTVRVVDGGPPARLAWRVATREYADPGPVPTVAPAGAGTPVAEGEITATGAGPVRLAIDQDGDTLRFFVDDQLVHDGGIPGVARSGLVGFVVESINAEVAHVHFDYLAVAVSGAGT